MTSKFPKFDEIVKDIVPAETNTKNTTVLHGREKKRAWFRDLYSGGEPTRVTKPKLECKFYSSTGKCRQGLNCHFVHSERSSSRSVISEPCKFLYMESRVCKKGESCHFSHDLSKFPCPYYFGRRDSICPHNCEFDHHPIFAELSAMQFARMYQVYLQSLGEEANRKWSFYYKDLTEEEVLNLRTNKSATNVFNVPIK